MANSASGQTVGAEGHVYFALKQHFKWHIFHAVNMSKIQLNPIGPWGRWYSLITNTKDKKTTRE